MNQQKDQIYPVSTLAFITWFYSSVLKMKLTYNLEVKKMHFTLKERKNLKYHIYHRTMPSCIHGSVMTNELVVELGHNSVMANQCLCFSTKLK